ncbi:zinc finger BED domain-containing protein RICESLEEPER 2-like [Canna indica]|uniref:Zinc finger BED domain-containing protein RICESLEEPER 2-like n=1 Tax=Canna indica TaxID=4628 RepID=A0AAQ3JT00_9LILI|nr:zinc finger BED domain-containing protein RICESLEEPER 2-like [Canna indica]
MDAMSYNISLEEQANSTPTSGPPYLELAMQSVEESTNLNMVNEVDVKSATWPSNSRSADVQNWKYNQVEMRELISHMVLVHELPFDFVEYEMFNMVMKFANHAFESISCAAASGDCLTSYRIEKMRLKALLKTVNRWNATYEMLLCALEFKNVFSRFQVQDSSYEYLPSEEDWNKVKEVCYFLEIFNDITTLISAILDPRNKMQLVTFCFDAICSKEEASKYIKVVRDSLYEIYQEYADAYVAEVNKSNNIESGQDGGSGCNSSIVVRKRKFGTQKGRLMFDQFMRTHGTVKSELDTYLDDDLYICHEDPELFDALEWWKVNNLKYKILSKMAFDILSIPVSTVAFEATFSAGGRVIDSYSSSLGTDTVEMLLFGSDWYRNFYGIHKKIEILLSRTRNVGAYGDPFKCPPWSLLSD